MHVLDIRKSHHEQEVVDEIMRKLVMIKEESSVKKIRDRAVFNEVRINGRRTIGWNQEVSSESKRNKEETRLKVNIPQPQK